MADTKYVGYRFFVPDFLYSISRLYKAGLKVIRSSYFDRQLCRFHQVKLRKRFDDNKDIKVCNWLSFLPYVAVKLGVESATCIYANAASNCIGFQD